MSAANEILEAYGAAYAAGAADLPGHNAAWTSALREEAIQAFRKSGFPSRKSEAWRYTDLRPLKGRFYPASAPAPSPASQGLPRRRGIDGARIVLVDGRFDQGLSTLGQLDPAITFMSMAGALNSRPQLVEEHIRADAGDDGVRQLNTALMADGWVIIASPGTRPEFPVEILYLTSGGAGTAGTAAHVRNLLLLGEGSRLGLIESHKGDGDFWHNLVTNVSVGAGARLNHFQSLSGGRKKLHASTTSIAVAADGSYRNFAFTAGGRVARNEIRVTLQAPGAQADLDGLTMARRGQSLANVTIVEHRSEAAVSNQHYKSILDAGASTAFLGKIVVAKDAQRSVAHQASDNLLLGKGAVANTKPELLIRADDVKCSHGATVGALDQAALFYLNSRGLDPEAAREILVAAFAEEILESVSIGPLREIVRNDISRWMRSSAGTINGEAGA